MAVPTRPVSSGCLSLLHIQFTYHLIFTGDYIPFGYFTDLEFNIGIACICMPSIRVVVRRYFPNCGLATTEGSSMIGPNHQPAPRLVRIPGKNHSRSTKTSNHRVTADTSSDRVELYAYDRRPETT